MNILQISAAYLDQSGGVSLHVHDLVQFLVHFYPETKIDIITSKAKPKPKLHSSEKETEVEINDKRDHEVKRKEGIEKYGEGNIIEWRVPRTQIDHFSGQRLFEGDIIDHAFKKLTHKDNAGIDIIHAHDWDSFYIGQILAAGWKKPLVITAHRAPKKWYPGRIHSSAKDAFMESIKNSIKDFSNDSYASTTIVTPSFASKSVLEDQGFKDVKVIQHGVSRYLASFEVDANILDDYNIPSDRKIILCPVRAESTKTPEVLIEAAPSIIENYPNEKLLFLFLSNWEGKGIDVNEKILEENAVKHGLVNGENVMFLPQIQYGKPLATIIKSSFLVVIPSLNESFGLSVLDSFACMRPVVARNSMALPEIINDEVNGLLFSDENDLTTRIGWLLDNPDLYNRIIKNAHFELYYNKDDPTINGRFSIRRMINDYVDLYKTLMR